MITKNSDGLESSRTHSGNRQHSASKLVTSSNSGTSKIRIKLKSYDTKILDETAKKITETLRKLGIRFYGPTPLPVKHTFISVLKSPHVHKDARQLFEIRESTRIVVIDESKAAISALNELKYSHPAITVSIKMSFFLLYRPERVIN